MGGRKKTFHIIVEPAEDSPGEWYVATSPDLPGLVTQGKGLDETVANVKDAILAYFDGKPPAHTLDLRIAVSV